MGTHQVNDMLRPSHLLPLLAVIAACGADGIPGPPVGLDQATASRSCGPTDGPAVAITLGSALAPSVQPPPYLVVSIQRDIGQLAPASWNIGDPQGLVGATFVPTPGTYESATLGRVTITRVDTTAAIEGAVSLTFPSRRVSGGFRAEWISRFPACG